MRLLGAGHVVRLAHRRIDPPIEVVPNSVTDTDVRVTLPNDAAAQGAFAAGQFALSLRFTPAGEVVLRDTNAIPLILAPVPVIAADVGLGLPAASALRFAVPPQVVVTLNARPHMRLAQAATLVLDSVEAVAEPRVAAADALTFVFPGSLAAGPHWVRLRVDGADSILLDQSGPAPVFDVTQSLVVPV